MHRSLASAPQTLTVDVRNGRVEYVHDGKTSPLHSNLEDPQQSRCTLEATQARATAQGMPAGGNGDDIAERASARGRAEEHEVGAYAF